MEFELKSLLLYQPTEIPSVVCCKLWSSSGCGCEVIFGCLKSREFILNLYRLLNVIVENTAISLV